MRFQVIEIQMGHEYLAFETDDEDKAKDCYINLVTCGGYPRVRIDGRLLLISEAESWSAEGQKKWRFRRIIIPKEEREGQS